MVQNAEQCLDIILRRNPTISITDRRNLNEHQFVLIGQELIKIIPELYLTTHSPKMENETSYRIWTEKPDISNSGHFDWYPITAVVEMWKTNSVNEEEKIFSLISRGCVTASPTPQVFSDSSKNYCQKARIYKIK
jgi:hypothetical protein